MRIKRTWRPSGSRRLQMPLMQRLLRWIFRRRPVKVTESFSLVEMTECFARRFSMGSQKRYGTQHIRSKYLASRKLKRKDLKNISLLS